MSTSLSARSTPRTVRLRVAQDTNRAERIRQLKADHPEMTWGYIADRVGVKERSAVEWQRSGGLNSENAAKLADVFGVSFDYLWFGKEKTPTPDILAGVSDREQVEDVRTEFQGYVREIIDKLDTGQVERDRMQLLIDEQNNLLAEQANLLKELRQVVAVLPAVREALSLLRREEDVDPSVQRPELGDAEAPDVAGERSRRTG